jgi:hypothetical protein
MPFDITALPTLPSVTLTAYEQGLMAVERRDYGAARELLEPAGLTPGGGLPFAPSARG